jgi:hypothetical protein
MSHHALREQAGKRLFHIDHADMRECTCPETRIEQMQNRMLDAADILIDGQPFFGNFAVERLIMWLAGKANEIPA